MRLLLFSTMISLLLIVLAGCSSSGVPSGDPDDAGLVLADGFDALVVADSVGRGRHIAVNANGDIYMKLRTPNEDGHGLAALRDEDGDGRADQIEYYGEYEDTGNYGTAMRIHDGHIYFSTRQEVYRQALTEGELIPQSEVQTVMADDFQANAAGGTEHTAKPIAFDNEGHIYIPFGSPGDVCQEPKRTPGQPGLDPCPQLERHAGVWQFDADGLNQTQADGVRYATGIRSLVAMTWNNETDDLYAVQHGRDHFVRMWPELYSPWESALLPSEEFMRVREGSDFGWPYCYYDQFRDLKLLNPEYGGDKEAIGRCAEKEDPLIGFPGHFAPNDILFYTGDQFPERYKNGAFIAFHGSTIRMPYPQGGYTVAFVPFENGEPSGEWEVFANGFAVVDPIVNTRDALARPMGLSQGPDGSLYISDSVKGKIWRIVYPGDPAGFSEEDLEPVRQEKLTASNIKTPHEEDDNLQKGVLEGGELVYQTYCAACHQGDGEGSPPRYPPLTDTDWVSGNKARLLSIIVNGLQGPIEVNGEEFNFPMPAHGFLSDEEVAQVATFIRQNFGNDASAVTEAEVRQFRERQ
ncbi:MAG: c-type cytochrome [Balneolaceae bacterium]